MTSDGARQIAEFLKTPLAEQLLRGEQLISTRFLSQDDIRETGLSWSEDRVLLEHKAIPFPSYPYEWPPEMLHRAAELTLELSVAALDQDYWLKDASPYNVLFRGPEAVLVDVPSFEKRNPLDCTWRSYAQFSRAFLLVLLAARELGRSVAESLLLHRDGPSLLDTYRCGSVFQRFRPVFFTQVSLPVWLDQRQSTDDSTLYRQRTASSPEAARFVLSHVYGSLRRSLSRVAPQARESVWTGYIEHKSLYSSENLSIKDAFVQRSLSEHRPATVLDIGCNQGHFSEIAARGGASVVAIDSDPVVVGRIWRIAREKRLDILPLVVDFARPTPAVGWCNEECRSFLERSTDKFDMILMLAVVHHLAITERIPMPMILKTAADITRQFAVIEFVGPEDPMFRRLVRGRDSLYHNLTVEHFEREAGCFFRTLQKQRLPGLDRWLFLFAKRSTPSSAGY